MTSYFLLYPHHTYGTINDMQRIFLTTSPDPSSIPLSPTTFHHLIHVCRLGPGDTLEAVHDGQLYKMTITRIDNEQTGICVAITDHHPLREKTATVSIIQSLPKQDKLTTIVGLCTQAGCESFHPIVSAYCQVSSVSSNKHQRALTAIDTAAKQSRQSRIPVLHSVVGLSDFLNDAPWPDPAVLLLADEASDDTVSLPTTPCPPIYIAIGPEGGWSPRDRSAFLACGFQSFTMGPSILRTEYAGFAAMHYVTGQLDRATTISTTHR